MHRFLPFFIYRFVTELEEPVYRCKHCNVEFAVYIDPITRIPPPFEYPAIHGKLYYFSKCFNVVVGTNEVMIDNENGSPMFEVFCICYGSHIGLKYKGVEILMYNDGVLQEGVGIVMYNEGDFLINRFKLNGPPDGSEDEPYHPESDDEPYNPGSDYDANSGSGEEV